MHQPTQSAKSWTLDNVPYGDVDPSMVRDQEHLFYLVTAASFIEIAADLYTDNLIQYFDGDQEVVDWLENKWKPEEVRHGYVLRDYVAHVWPGFDWQAAYDGFFQEYSRMCTVDEFEPSRCLEMVARCVVETGTSTFYQAMSQLTEEPVLAGIVARIRADEVGHYKYFYRFFRQYSATEPPGRIKILAALKRRMIEARNDDAECALRHAYAIRCRQGDPGFSSFKELMSTLGAQVKRHYPVDMAAKMLIKPLDLPRTLARLLQGPVATATKKIML